MSRDANVLDYERVGEFHGIPVARVTLDHLPADISSKDRIIADEHGNGRIESPEGETKGIIKDLGWYDQFNR